MIFLFLFFTHIDSVGFPDFYTVAMWMLIYALFDEVNYHHTLLSNVHSDTIKQHRS